MSKRYIKLDDLTVVFEDTSNIRDAVFEEVLKYFINHECFCAESICQSDGPLIEAPYHLAGIADNIIKFEVTYE